MNISDFKTILKEESIAALGVTLGVVIGLLLDNLILGLFGAAGLLLISRAVTFVQIKNRHK